MLRGRMEIGTHTEDIGLELIPGYHVQVVLLEKLGQVLYSLLRHCQGATVC